MVPHQKGCFRQGTAWQDVNGRIPKQGLEGGLHAMPRQIRTWLLGATALSISLTFGSVPSGAAERRGAEPPVLNSPWSGVPSFGAAPSPSVLAAVSPPLLGGFLGPATSVSADSLHSGDRSRRNAGLAAMLARNPVNIPGALGGPSGSIR